MTHLFARATLDAVDEVASDVVTTSTLVAAVIFTYYAVVAISTFAIVYMATAMVVTSIFAYSFY